MQSTSPLSRVPVVTSSLKTPAPAAEAVQSASRQSIKDIFTKGIYPEQALANRKAVFRFIEEYGVGPVFKGFFGGLGFLGALKLIQPLVETATGL